MRFQAQVSGQHNRRRNEGKALASVLSMLVERCKLICKFLSLELSDRFQTYKANFPSKTTNMVRALLVGNVQRRDKVGIETRQRLHADTTTWVPIPTILRLKMN